MPQPSDVRVDFAVHGTSPLAGLLAGGLAQAGKSVVRVAQRRSPQRLARDLDLALPLSARPDAWRMLRAGEARLAALLKEAGAVAAWSETSVSVVADTDRTAALLDHLAHLAAGYGHQIARLPRGWALRRVPILRREGLDEAVSAWLARMGVPTLDEGPVEAATQLLADDDAILDAFRSDDLPPELVIEPVTATQLALPRPLPMPVELLPDRGVSLVQGGSTALALVNGNTAVEARLGSALAGPFPIRRLATTRFRRLVSTDGAPVIGLHRGQFMLAGLGRAGVFLAPTLARHLAGTADAAERDWFEAHAPGRPRDGVADFVARLEPRMEP